MPPLFILNRHVFDATILPFFIVKSYAVLTFMKNTLRALFTANALFVLMTDNVCPFKSSTKDLLMFMF